MFEIGITMQLCKTIEPKDSAITHGSGSVNVFATPAMIAFMEKTCLELAANNLPEQKSTVGILVNIKHLKATSIGKKVYCTAKLIEFDDKFLTFEVKVLCNEDIIGEGIHKRAIIDIDKFISKLK